MYTDENMKIASWLAYQKIDPNLVNAAEEGITIMEALKRSGIYEPSEDADVSYSEREIWNLVKQEPYSSWKITNVKAQS